MSPGEVNPKGFDLLSYGATASSAVRVKTPTY